MQRYRGVAQDTAGNILASTTVTVYKFGTTTLASIYSNDSTSALANPFTNNDDGTYEFYAPNGRYDVALSKTGYSFPSDNGADISLYDYNTPIGLVLTGTVNDYVPPVQDNWHVSGPATLTGVVPRQDYHKIIIINIHPSSLMISHENSSSAATNRFTNYPPGDLNLSQNQYAVYEYFSYAGRWKRIG